jgi:hypothetical protein
MSVDRRGFLQLAALGAAAVAHSACGGESDLTGGSLDGPELLAMLGAERVRQIGTQYRSATPGENDVSVLRALVSDSQKKSWFRSESIDERIRGDFAANRTVLVDGWVLSVTEARQAALLSLTPA